MSDNTKINDFSNIPWGRASALSDRSVVPGSIWRHFKGSHIATVIGLAKSTVDNTMQVIYTCFCIDGDLDCNTIWVRPMDEFLSETPHEKYPQYSQKYRFDRIK